MVPVDNRVLLVFAAVPGMDGRVIFFSVEVSAVDDRDLLVFEEALLLREVTGVVMNVVNFSLRDLWVIYNIHKHTTRQAVVHFARILQFLYAFQGCKTVESVNRGQPQLALIVGHGVGTEILAVGVGYKKIRYIYPNSRLCTKQVLWCLISAGRTVTIHLGLPNELSCDIPTIITESGIRVIWLYNLILYLFVNLAAVLFSMPLDGGGVRAKTSLPNEIHTRRPILAQTYGQTYWSCQKNRTIPYYL